MSGREMPELFMRYANDYDRLFLADVGGVVWASNSYWAVPVQSENHPIARLLALYNLPLAPCVLWSGETLTPDTAGRTEKLDNLAILVKSAPDGLEPLTRYCLHGEWHGGPDPLKPVYLRHEGRTTGMLMGVRCRASEYVPPTEVDVMVATGA